MIGGADGQLLLGTVICLGETVVKNAAITMLVFKREYKQPPYVEKGASISVEKGASSPPGLAVPFSGNENTFAVGTDNTPTQLTQFSQSGHCVVRIFVLQTGANFQTSVGVEGTFNAIQKLSDKLLNPDQTPVVQAVASNAPYLHSS